jgi:formamidopyrimidine-DNA glycosylase
MPELPDVEIARRLLTAEGLGRRIVAVDVLDQRPLRDLPSKAFVDALVGRRFTATCRRGKWLFAEVEAGPWVALHFRMAGRLALTAPGEAVPPHARVTFRFADGGALHFDDQRRFGVLTLTPDPTAFCDERRLGPDALDPALTPEVFAQRLEHRSGPLKGALLNQSFVAGIGNIYGDEICFAARMAPLSQTAHFSAEDRRAVFRATRAVLRTAVDRMGEGRDFPSGWLIRERRPGGVCPRCGEPVARVRYQGRYTYWCPCVQRVV